MSEADEAVIRIEDLIKEFDVGLRGLRLRAVDRLSLRIPRGEVFGLLGPNGSGKSTTIKILLGLMKPTSGTCSILGEAAGNLGVRGRIGYLPESPDFYRFLTGYELVTFYGRMADMKGALLKAIVEHVLEMVGLVDKLSGAPCRCMAVVEQLEVLLVWGETEVLLTRTITAAVVE